MGDDVGLNELLYLANELSAKMDAREIIDNYREETIKQRNSLPKTPHLELTFPDGTIVYAEKAIVDDMESAISEAGAGISGTEVYSVSAEQVRTLGERYYQTLDVKLHEGIKEATDVNRDMILGLSNILKQSIRGIFEPPKIEGHEIIDASSLEHRIETYTPDLGA